MFGNLGSMEKERFHRIIRTLCNTKYSSMEKERFHSDTKYSSKHTELDVLFVVYAETG